MASSAGVALMRLVRASAGRGKFAETGGWVRFSQATASTRMMSTEPAAEFVDQQLGSGGVMIFSKMTCPYCSAVKSLFEELGAPYKAHELDQIAQGSSIQNELRRRTGQSSVPNVFIGGKHVGGCDDTYRLDEEGKLINLLETAGVALRRD